MSSPSASSFPAHTVTTVLWLYNTPYHDSIPPSLPLPFFISDLWQFAYYNSPNMKIDNDGLRTMMFASESTQNLFMNFTDTVIPLAFHPYKVGNAEIFQVTQTAPVLSALQDFFVFSVQFDDKKTSNAQKVREALSIRRPLKVHFISHNHLSILIQQYKKKETTTAQLK